MRMMCTNEFLLFSDVYHGRKVERPLSLDPPCCLDWLRKLVASPRQDETQVNSCLPPALQIPSYDLHGSPTRVRSKQPRRHAIRSLPSNSCVYKRHDRLGGSTEDGLLLHSHLRRCSTRPHQISVNTRSSPVSGDSPPSSLVRVRKASKTPCASARTR